MPKIYFNINKTSIPGIPNTPVINAVKILIDKCNPTIAPKKLNIKRITKPIIEFNINLNNILTDFPKSHTINARIIMPIANGIKPDKNTKPPHIIIIHLLYHMKNIKNRLEESKKVELILILI